jgi:hypothetical protein
VNTYKGLLYRPVIIGCFFLVSNVIISGQVFAQTGHGEIQVKTLKVLPRSGYRSDLGLFLDVDDSLIAFCGRDNINGRDGNNIFIFRQQQGKWIETEKVYKGMSSRIISSDKLQLVTYGDLRQSKSPLEIYDLTKDLQVAEQPRLSLDLYSEQKFKKEFKTSYRNIQSIAASESPDSFLVLGEYTADNLNLFTLFGRIISAGHAGIVDIPFAAQITEGKVVGFYDLQTKYEDNEYASAISGITEGRIVHITWRKGKNYCADTPKIMYAQFNLDTHIWSKVYEVFRGTKYDSESIRYSRDPSALVLNGSLHCAWSYANIKKDTKTPLDNSGIFYRCKDPNGWNSICKISDSAASQCKLVVGQNQGVHLFWVDYKKGIYHTYKDANGWQDATLIYEDSDLDWTLPFDVKIDKTGNIHLLYIRRVPNEKPINLKLYIQRGSYVTPFDLMYVKIKK